MQVFSLSAAIASWRRANQILECPSHLLLAMTLRNMCWQQHPIPPSNKASELPGPPCTCQHAPAFVLDTLLQTERDFANDLLARCRIHTAPNVADIRLKQVIQKRQARVNTQGLVQEALSISLCSEFNCCC